MTMPIETCPFDPAEYLDTPEAVTEYLIAAFESGEYAVRADARGNTS
jgi:DNA-binding phage protein